MTTHYDANDEHHINTDDVLEPGMEAPDGSHYHLEAEWNEAQEAFLVTLGGNGGDFGLPTTSTANGKVF